MLFGFHLLGPKDMGHHALLVNDKCRAECAHIGAPVELFLRPNPESLLQGRLGVSDQSEGELLFLDNPLV